MTIEHRYSSRTEIELQVQLKYRNRRFFSARGRNISDQGMYLEIQNLALPTGTLIETEFQCLGRHWAIESIVVYRDARGVGVMFRNPQPALFRDLGQVRSEGPFMHKPTPSPSLLQRG